MSIPLLSLSRSRAREREIFRKVIMAEETKKIREDGVPTYEGELAKLSESAQYELVNRKLDCIMQAVEYLWNQYRAEAKPNVVDPELQIPVYPQPNVIIYETPNKSGHPPFYADSDYIAEGWPWPDVPPPPA